MVVDRTRTDYRNYGFEASRCEYLDLAEAGIIDPTKVVCIGLEKGASLASVLLLTEAMLTELPASLWGAGQSVLIGGTTGTESYLLINWHKPEGRPCLLLNLPLARGALAVRMKEFGPVSAEVTAGASVSQLGDRQLLSSSQD